MNDTTKDNREQILRFGPDKNGDAIFALPRPGNPDDEALIALLASVYGPPAECDKNGQPL